jgi:hypothetical protein
MKEKVMCLDNKFVEDLLTVNRIYTIVGREIGSFTVVADNDIEHEFFRDRFVAMKEYRRIQLIKLLND